MKKFKRNLSTTLVVTFILLFFVACDNSSSGGGGNSSGETKPTIKIPQNNAQAVNFSDIDPEIGEIGGEIKITAADNESDVNDYVIYWGSDASTKTNEIETLRATRTDLVYNLPLDTTIPVNTTHIIVFTKNTAGEAKTGVSVEISDYAGEPLNNAQAVTFTDGDPTAGEIAGELSIIAAQDESDVENYVIYWASNASTKTTEITTLAATGNNLTYTIPANTTIPVSTTHIIVYTNNSKGEALTGVSVLLNDLNINVPLNDAQAVSFIDTDYDRNQISCSIEIIKAFDESDVENYAIYWGSDATTKMGLIAVKPKTGNNIYHFVNSNTAIPAGAEYILVFTRNAAGNEPLTCAASEIKDLTGCYYVAVGHSKIVSSPDGVNWSVYDLSPTYRSFQSVASGNGRFVAVGHNGIIYDSTNGVSWNEQPVVINESLTNIEFVNNQFVISVLNSDMLISEDGVNWTQKTAPYALMYGIHYAKGRYVYVGSDGKLFHSEDLDNWTVVYTGMNSSLVDVCYGQNGAGRMNVVLNSSGGILRSFDYGITWTPNGVTGLTSSLAGITWTGSRFIVVGSSGNIFTASEYADKWYKKVSNTTQNLKKVAAGNGLAVVVGNSGTIVTAPSLGDYTTWTVRVSGTTVQLNDVTFGQIYE